MYEFKNIRDLLFEGFSKEELIDLCFYEPALKPICEQFVPNTTNPKHLVWLETRTGFRKEKEFHFIGQNADVWEFKWRD